MFQSPPLKSLCNLTAVEAVLRHVCVIGLATSVQVPLQVPVKVLLQALVIVVVCLHLRESVSEIQC